MNVRVPDIFGWSPAAVLPPRLLFRALAVLAVLTVCTAVNLVAQVRPTQPVTTLGSAMTELGARQAELLASGGGLSLEGAVDESLYVVGPGDVFSVSRGGLVPLSTMIQVSAEGNLVVPEIGPIQVAGLTLGEARRVALDAIKPSYVNESVAVSLQEPRKFYVHVAGAVPQPGRFLASAVSRVDDVLHDAYGRRQFDFDIAVRGRSEADREALQRMLPLPSADRPDLSEDYRPSLRTITIERRDGSKVAVDLMMYYATGNTDWNPYLQDGDVVRIGAYRSELEAVRVSGPVPYPGYYVYRDRDTVDDLLAIAYGSNNYTINTEVRIISRSGSGSEAVLLTGEDLQSGAGSRTMLATGDHIMVLPEDDASAGVFGWVKYPGSYPILSGKTTLKRVVADAGGLKDDANVRLAYLERRSPTFLKSVPGVSDLDFFGRVNFRTANSTRRILIDVADALESETDFVLEDGDVVVFPREESTVYVVGNVPRGGYVQYREGWTASDYIAAAGGLAAQSRDVFVFASVSGVSYKGVDQPVRPGDTIFVDRVPTTDSPELQSLLVTERTSRRQLKLASIQTIITGVSAVAAVITTVVAIRR